MSGTRTNSEMDGFIRELQKLADDSMKVFGGLKPAQLNWKPSAGQWSVGQCFDHLITTNRCFFPSFTHVAVGKHKNSLWQRVSPLSGFFARFILGALDPVKGRSIKAPRVFRPTASDVEPAVILKFTQNLSEAAGLMRATETAGADLRGTIVTSPVSPLVTYSLLDAYRIMVAHGRKHFEQARKVTEAEGFPTA